MCSFSSIACDPARISFNAARKRVLSAYDFSRRPIHAAPSAIWCAARERCAKDFGKQRARIHALKFISRADSKSFRNKTSKHAGRSERRVLNSAVALRRQIQRMQVPFIRERNLVRIEGPTNQRL